MHTTDQAIPDGFIPLPSMGFTEKNGPLYVSTSAIPDKLVFGFRVEPQHVNVVGGCHGGMMMLLADMQLPLAAHYQANLDDRFLPTVNLTADFLASPQLGDWVTGETDVVRITRNLVFTQGVFKVGDQPVLRANGIFKRMGPAPEGHTGVDTHRLMQQLRDNQIAA